MTKTWKDYPIKKDINNNYYVAFVRNNNYVSDYHVIPNDAMGAFNYNEVADFYNSLTGKEQVYNAEGELVTQKQEYIVPEPTLDELKADKLAEIDAWTAAKITGGFVSNASGEAVTYDSDKDTQLTMQGIALNVNTELFAEKYPDGCPVRGYPAGSETKQIYMLTPAQVMQWQADLSIHIGTCKQNGWAKQAEVAAAESKEDLEAIVLI